MALWPTCPVRGPPGTEERSSRKLSPKKNILMHLQLMGSFFLSLV